MNSGNSRIDCWRYILAKVSTRKGAHCEEESDRRLASMFLGRTNPIGERQFPHQAFKHFLSFVISLSLSLSFSSKSRFNRRQIFWASSTQANAANGEQVKKAHFTKFKTNSCKKYFTISVFWLIAAAQNAFQKDLFLTQKKLSAFYTVCSPKRSQKNFWREKEEARRTGKQMRVSKVEIRR